MFDITWRSLLIILVFLTDLVVFADLAREELREWRAAKRRREGASPPLAGRGPAAPMAGQGGGVACPP